MILYIHTVHFKPSYLFLAVYLQDISYVRMYQTGKQTLECSNAQYSSGHRNNEFFHRQNDQARFQKKKDVCSGAESL